MGKQKSLFRAPLKIQSSPKCKAWKKFGSAAYDLYVSKKFFASIRYAACLLTLCRNAA